MLESRQIAVDIMQTAAVYSQTALPKFGGIQNPPYKFWSARVKYPENPQLLRLVNSSCPCQSIVRCDKIHW